VFIQAIHTPTVRPNIAASCTRLSARTFTSEFGLAAEKLAEGNWQWCLPTTEVATNDFFTGYGAFVRISMDVWDANEIGSDKVREMVGGLESRIPALMVKLGRLDGVYARAWPARFWQPPAEEFEKTGTQFKGYYFVGISAKYQNEAGRKRLLSGKVLTAVREFERAVRDGKEFQNGNVWLDMDVIPKKKILELDLVIDKRDWVREISAASPNQDYHDADHDNEVGVVETAPTVPTKAPVSRKTGPASLRPAQDIIARIKWDPQLVVTDFLIGYEDRFVGVKETDLRKWKSEQTDEEFIPMHRIVWVRRKGEHGEKVWDRKNKIDKIFGSGRGNGR
jgi:uncharacterized protein (UPF0248 family)